MTWESVVIEADGGSRGNPGRAAYGAVLKDAVTGEVIAEDGTAIGIASNNVAEYNGLIAGLRMAAELAPEASIEVRMDSKLVVEQMSGNWKIKHPDMRPLALEANRLAPFGTTYVWIPREKNKHADRLVNEALDGKRQGVTVLAGVPTPEEESLAAELTSPAMAPVTPEETGAVRAPFARPGGPVTTLLLVRHGVTPHTLEKRFSSGLGGENPGLSDEGREQVRLTADWLRPVADRIDVIVASPVRRTIESADIVAGVLGKPVLEDAAFAEMEFGRWDGLTFGEALEQYPREFRAWAGSVEAAPPGGESFVDAERRVLAGLAGLLERHRGETVVLVSHANPIKILAAHALDAPLTATFRMETVPAAVTVLSFFEPVGDEPRRASMRLYNGVPPERSSFLPASTSW